MNQRTVRWIRKITRVDIVLIFSLFFILSIVAGCGGGDTGGSPVNGKSVTLAWDPPTENADGSPLTDLAGFKLYYGTSSLSYGNSIIIGNSTTYTAGGLRAGTYYFAVTAYDIYGNESGYSDEVTVNLE